MFREMTVSGEIEGIYRDTTKSGKEVITVRLYIGKIYSGALYLKIWDLNGHELKEGQNYQFYITRIKLYSGKNGPGIDITATIARRLDNQQVCEELEEVTA